MSDNPEPRKLGRPSSYSEQTANDILAMIESGMTLTTICNLPDMPHISTIYDWQDSNPEFAERYSRARTRQADTLASRVIDEAMTSSDAPIGRLRMDALKWFASKMSPKKYGDKVELETNTNQNFKISFSVPDRDTQDSLKELSAPNTPAVLDIVPELVAKSD
jgi:hypothetical protein